MFPGSGQLSNSQLAPMIYQALKGENPLIEDGNKKVCFCLYLFVLSEEIAVFNLNQNRHMEAILV